MTQGRKADPTRTVFWMNGPGLLYPVVAPPKTYPARVTWLPCTACAVLKAPGAGRREVWQTYNCLAGADT